MTTAPTPLHAVDSAPIIGDFAVDKHGYAVDDAPRTTFPMAAKVRVGRKISKQIYHLTAYAIADAGSALNIIGSREDDGAKQLRGIHAFLMRALVDDDGVPYDANPALVTEDDLDAAFERANPEFSTDTEDDEPIDEGPDPIPGDAELKRMRVADLSALAGEHGLITEGTKAELTAGLQTARDYLAQAGTALTTTDDITGEAVDASARWRLVYPDGQLADESDEAVFDDLVAARRYIDDHPSSRRLLFAVLSDPDRTVEPSVLWEIYGHIASKAATRPPAPSSTSSRSQRRAARRGRT